MGTHLQSLKSNLQKHVFHRRQASSFRLRRERRCRWPGCHAGRIPRADPIGHCQLCAHQPSQECPTGHRSEKDCWRADQCRVLGYRSSCRSYPACPRWRYPPQWTGCFREYVPRRSHVRSTQDLEAMAQTVQRQPATICYDQRHRCYWCPSSRHGQGSHDRQRPRNSARCQQRRSGVQEDQAGSTFSKPSVLGTISSESTPPDACEPAEVRCATASTSRNSDHASCMPRTTVSYEHSETSPASTPSTSTSSMSSASPQVATSADSSSSPRKPLPPSTRSTATSKPVPPPKPTGASPAPSFRTPTSKPSCRATRSRAP